MRWGLSIISSQRVLNRTFVELFPHGHQGSVRCELHLGRFAYLPRKSTLGLLTKSRIIPTPFCFHSGNKARDRHRKAAQAAWENISRSLHWECGIPTRVSRWEILIYSFLLISVCSGFTPGLSPFFCSSSQRNEFPFSL